MNSDLILFASFIFIASVSPGPNILIVVINSMKVGWRKAYWTIAGNLLALLFIALAAALGIGALLIKSHTLFSLLKIFGGLYLIYLGYKLWQGRKNPIEISDTEKEARSKWQLFIDGFTVSLSNPKSVIFLASVFPQFIDTQVPLVPQFVMMFGIIVCTVGLIHGAYSLFAFKLAKTVKSSTLYSRIKTVSATMFCGFGIVLASEGSSSLRH